jgi:sugar phosphate isomerase/epimerase
MTTPRIALAMTTDYQKDTGCPEPYLKAIAESGYSHVHWCHHWNSDFLYSESEIGQIGQWLKEYGLQVIDLHASAGQEKGWGSAKEYERLAGVELVENRIRMAAELGSDVIILHVPSEPGNVEERGPYWARLRKSLDTLEPLAKRTGVRIALENSSPSNFGVMEQLFALYRQDFLGLCYDSGHGNMAGDGLAKLDSVKHRLISLHLHDNDGQSDQHKLLFSGTVKWEELARLIAESSYRKCLSMETVMKNTGIQDPFEFLARAFETGTKLDGMVRAWREPVQRS